MILPWLLRPGPNKVMSLPLRAMVASPIAPNTPTSKAPAANCTCICPGSPAIQCRSKPELNEGSSEAIAARQIEPALPGVGSVTFTTGFACAIASNETKAGLANAPAMPARILRRDNRPPIAALNMDRPFKRLVAPFGATNDDCLRNQAEPGRYSLAGTIRRRRATRDCFCRP